MGAEATDYSSSCTMNLITNQNMFQDWWVTRHSCWGNWLPLLTSTGPHHKSKHVSLATAISQPNDSSPLKPTKPKVGKFAHMAVVQYERFSSEVCCNCIWGVNFIVRFGTHTQTVIDPSHTLSYTTLTGTCGKLSSVSQPLMYTAQYCSEYVLSTEKPTFLWH